MVFFLSSILEILELRATNINIEDEMATALIDHSNNGKQISAEITNGAGNMITLSGVSKLGSNWKAAIQKKFSDGNWYDVMVINSNQALVTISDIGTFRVVKEAGVVCLIDRD